jgi:hypothetical protein
MLIRLIFSMVLILAQGLTGAIIFVPTDQPTIQAGIDQAQAGDTVLVAGGTYTGSGNVDLDFNGKAITLVGDLGAEYTIIDCQGSEIEPHRGFYFHDFEDENTVIDGFKVINGYGDEKENRMRGGAMFLFDAGPVIKNCIFSHNTGPHSGGAIDGFRCSPTFINCIFYDNSASFGGALYFNGFDKKTTTPSEKTATFIECKFYDNSSVERGGALYIQYADATAVFEKCLFYNNTSDKGGAIATNEESTVELHDCTVVYNTAASGAGAHIDEHTTIVSFNSIYAFNQGGGAIRMLAPIPSSFECSDIFGNEGGDWVGNLYPLKDINGNLSADPMFCSPLDHDYQINSASPCAPANNSCGTLIGALGIGCGVIYICGDVNDDGEVNLNDVLFLQNYIFMGGEAPEPLVSGNVNCDEFVNFLDLVYLLNYLFRNGPEPCADCPF